MMAARRKLLMSYAYRFPFLEKAEEPFVLRSAIIAVILIALINSAHFRACVRH
jgi:hypothetical protein